MYNGCMVVKKKSMTLYVTLNIRASLPEWWGSE